MKLVIFACVHNAGRSQMAAAWFNQLADPAEAHAVSAGTEPGERVHPEVLAAMAEAGIDLSGAKPQLLTAAMIAGASRLVTMGCSEACPVVPSEVLRDDWPLEDPKGKSIERVRAIRDEVRGRVVALLDAEGLWPVSAASLLIRRATIADLTAVLRLARQAALPDIGIAEAIESFLVAERDGGIVGSAGLERYDDHALLRTVVVVPEGRGRGVGRGLVEAALRRARELELRGVYLLTTTAPDFFRRLGFEIVERQGVPDGIRRSWVFGHGCPDTAVVMCTSAGLPGAGSR